MSSTPEQQMRDGAPPNDGPLGGLPGPSAETDTGRPQPGGPGVASRGGPPNPPATPPGGCRTAPPRGESPSADPRRSPREGASRVRARSKCPAPRPGGGPPPPADAARRSP